MDSKNYSKLKPCAFGTAMGILWGVSIFLTAIIAMCCNWGGHFINVFASVYWGYDNTVLGAFIGLLWGFIDGFIAGFILAWIYNRCICCKCQICSCVNCKCNK